MKGDHEPDRNGGCWTFGWCECDRAAGSHCSYCGRPVEQLVSPNGNSARRHVGTSARLAALNESRKPR